MPSESSSEVDEGVDADPDRGLELPEHPQIEEARDDIRGEAGPRHLHDHHQHPKDAEGHMQPVRPNQHEIDREEAAAVRPIALGDEASEVAQFQPEENEAQDESDGGIEDYTRPASHLHRDG